MRPRFYTACLAVAATVSFAIAYLTHDHVEGVEGAYLDTSGGGGWTGYAPLDESAPGSLDPANSDLWLGAGLAFAVAAVAALVLGRFASGLARPS